MPNLRLIKAEVLKLRRRPFRASLSALRVLPLIYGHAIVLRAKGVKRA